VKKASPDGKTIITSKQDALALGNDNLTNYMMAHGENMTADYHHKLHMESQNTNFVWEGKQRFGGVYQIPREDMLQEDNHSLVESLDSYILVYKQPN
jgi:hypothetical protein